MRDLKSKLARETNRLTGWSGPVFERRYEMTVVTGEEAAQIERLQYVLAQSVKENLVERVREWPGVCGPQSAARDHSFAECHGRKRDPFANPLLGASATRRLSRAHRRPGGRHRDRGRPCNEPPG